MKVALVGNQNSGKTTFFNALTGSNQKVGNWPGVTIERKEGIIKGTDITVVDLPGIYSLSPYTSEEEVSRRYVLDDKPDLIINIVDSTSIERSLYLTTQLLELDCDVVVALNMFDLLEKEKIYIDEAKLSERFGCTFVKISAKSGYGIDNLIKVVKDKEYKKNEHIKIYPNDVELLITEIEQIDKKPNSRFCAVKVIEEDRDFKVLMTEQTKKDHEKIEEKYQMDGEQLIASLRYDFIVDVKDECVNDARETSNKETITDKLDKILLNKWAAIPIFVFIMALVYMLSVGLVGGLTVNLVDALFNGTTELKFNFFSITWVADLQIEGLGPLLARWLTGLGASERSVSLVEKGIVAGVGAVCNFIPQLIVLFICLAILETSGYMSRIAFFLDRVFHKFGLSGKSLIPFIVGTGCSVPGIMTARTVEDPNERKSTIILTPFMPCSAKLPILSIFASIFFGSWAWVVSLSFYFLAIFLILLFGFIFKKFVFKNEHTNFVSELPEYKLPSPKYVVRDVWDKTIAFIKRAGTIILFCSVIVWTLSSFTWSWEYVDNETITIDKSMLAGIGNAFAWIFYPMLGGQWSWAATVSSIQGLVAKEQVISSMEVIANVSGSASIFESSSFSFFNGWSAYAYMAFNMFSAPCIGAIGAMRQELGSVKNTIFAVIFQIGVAWVIGTIIGCIGWVVTLI